MKRTVYAIWAAAGLSALPVAALAAGDLVVGLAGDLRSMYPAGSTEDSSLSMQQQVYEGLVAWKENGDVGPMLAVDLPTVSDDGLTYTFAIREGVKFHDGTPLTAQTVVDSWNFLLNPETGWPCRQYFNGTNSVNVTSIAATGEMEVTFTLVTPAPELLTQMARSDCGEGGIMAPAVYGEPKAETMIGTGPFKVDSIAPGQKVKLLPYADYAARTEPSDGYTGKKEVLLDSLTYMIIPDPAANFAALMAGEIDVWAAVGLAYAPQIAAADGFTLSSVPIPSITTFALQTAKGPTANPLIRQAINMALDREAMVATISQGYAVPSASPVPTSSVYYGPVEQEGLLYDPEGAAAKLKEAGYNGEKITIITNKNYSIMFETGVMAQAYLQAVGINADIEVMDFATQLQRYYSGDYDMMTWNYAPTLDPGLILDRITGSKEAVASKIWDNPAARDLVNKLAQTPADGRQAVYDDIHRLYVEDAPMVVWSSAQATDGFSNKVKGFSAWAGRKPRFWGVSKE